MTSVLLVGAGTTRHEWSACGSRFWLPTLAVAWAIFPRTASAQPGQNDPPASYEVQIDGESFLVESGQRPVKVQSKLKPGTAYTLAVRVALTQVLRLNSVRLEYGMWAKVDDDKGKDIRRARIANDLGFSLRIIDQGKRLDSNSADKLLDDLTDEAVKRYTEGKATEIVKREPKSQKLGPSAGKWRKVTCKNRGAPRRGVGEACTSMIFVLSGEKYTIGAEAEYRDKDTDDVRPWVMNALESIRPLR